MSTGHFITIPMTDYRECVKCRASVNVANDGLVLHARQHRAYGANAAKLYRASPNRTVYVEDQPEKQGERT